MPKLINKKAKIVMLKWSYKKISGRGSVLDNQNTEKHSNIFVSDYEPEAVQGQPKIIKWRLFDSLFNDE